MVILAILFMKTPIKTPKVIPLAPKAIPTIRNFKLIETSNDLIKKLVDLKGDWKYYWSERDKKFKPSTTYVLSLGFNKGPFFQEYLLSKTKDEAKKILETAGDRGTRVHQVIREIIGGTEIKITNTYLNSITNRQEPLTDDEWSCLEAFQRFANDYKLEIINQEDTVETNLSIGTFDALAVITIPDKDKRFQKEVWGKRVLILLDWKTSSGIRLDYKAQVAEYWTGVTSIPEYLKYLKAFSDHYTGIVRIGTKHTSGYEIQAWTEEETERNHWSFVAAHKIYSEHDPNFEPDIRDIPTIISVKVPKVVLEKPKVKVKKKKVKLPK